MVASSAPSAHSSATTTAPAVRHAAEPAPSSRTQTLRRALSVLHALIGIGAIGGGALLVAQPSGAPLGLSPAELRGFASFLVPGALLIVLGFIQLAIALWVVRPGSRGLMASQIGGGVLVLWIAFESALIQPIFAAQIALMGLGALIFIVAHELHSDTPHEKLLP